MQIKKFRAASLKDAISLMKEQLGEEAVVLSTKVYEGDLKLGKKKEFEITAGFDDEPKTKDFLIDDNEPISFPNSSKNFETELKKLTNKIYGAANQTKDKKPEKEIISAEKLKNKKAFSDFQEVIDILKYKEVDDLLINTIVNQLKKYSMFLNKENIDNYVLSTISSMIPTSEFKITKGKTPKTIALIGPTGVGKTTCIAKLAVISKILHNLDIGLISIDTYRLGALDQLKIFAEVSNIDFLVAYEPSEMKSLMQKLKKKDLVFIDTVGRSQKNTSLLKGINDYLNEVNIDEKYLVMSTTSTTKNMIDVADKFKSIKYDGFVFTKIDEAVTYGNILNVVNKFNTPIKYLTNGQVIPDDIIAADPDFIANLIYTGSTSS
ncbi:MAG: flagellar biosynthesis protein FlhF [Melioribacteraceae bacterium]|jgi:flagellar biosynthesis protein FlhF|nr:flagellar biosynthesis protein FlhF [Melioribacteraceae bacterium]